MLVKLCVPQVPVTSCRLIGFGENTSGAAEAGACSCTAQSLGDVAMPAPKRPGPAATLRRAAGAAYAASRLAANSMRPPVPIAGGATLAGVDGSSASVKPHVSSKIRGAGRSATESGKVSALPSAPRSGEGGGAAARLTATFARYCEMEVIHVV